MRPTPHQAFPFAGVLLRALVGIFLAAAAPAAVAPATEGQEISAEWVHKWREDLEFLRSELPRTHADAFHSVSRAEFEAAMDDLEGRLPELRHHEAVVELARIIALVGDGHTRLTLPLGPGIELEQGHSSTPEPNLPAMLFHQFPVRLGIDARGPWIRRIEARHGAAVGGRPVAIDGRPIADAMAALAPSVQRDNEMQVLHHLSEHLVLPEVLHARGVLDSVDRATWTVLTAAGERIDVVLEAVPFGGELDWVDARDGASGPIPLYLRHPDRNFWFAEVPGRTVYCQFNEVYDTEKETIRGFAERLVAYLEEHRIERLILDLRANRGGNQSLSLPFLHALIGSPVDETGRLFALIGRATFSAAMKFSLDLEKHTRVLFVGEPTGSKPNAFGDSRKIILPNTNFTVRASTLFWQSHPRDRRPWIEPHFAVELAAEDYAANRDPAVEMVLALEAPEESLFSAAASAWQGAIRTDFGSVPLSVSLNRKGAAWTGSMSVPAFGIEEWSLEALYVGTDTIRFEIELQEGPLRFRGRVLGHTIVGDVDLGSDRFGLLLRPAAGTEPPA